MSFITQIFKGATSAATLKPRLFQLSEQGRWHDVRQAIREGADPSVTFPDWGAFLAHVCQYGDEDTVQFLLRRRVDVNVVDDMGTPALHLALIHQPTECVEALLKAGANPHGVDERGHTALEAALEAGTSEGAALLLEAGARVRKGRERIAARNAAKVYLLACSGIPQRIEAMAEVSQEAFPARRGRALEGYYKTKEDLPVKDHSTRRYIERAEWVYTKELKNESRRSTVRFT